MRMKRKVNGDKLDWLRGTKIDENLKKKCSGNKGWKVMGDDNEKDEWREKNMQRKDEGEWMKKK